MVYSGTFCQGKGVGKRLLSIAIKFCADVRHNKIFLWTFRGLDAARKASTDERFELADEKEVAQWGTVIVEQKFELEIGNLNTNNLMVIKR